MTKRFFLVSTLLGTSQLSWPQQTSNPASPVHSPLAQYPFGAAAQVLQSPAAVPPPLVVSRNPETATNQQATPALIRNPTVIPQRTELPVSPAGQEALTMSKEWQTGDPLPTPGKDGVVQFRFGAAMPPIICAPERQTLIKLQPGEHLTHEPILGDNTRWNPVVLTTGQGAEERTVIAIKFVKPGYFQTDLVLPTNRRIYQLNLQTNLTQHLSQVEFTYPEDSQENWRAYQAHEEQKQEQAAQREQSTVASLQGSPNYGYTIKVVKKQKSPFIPKTVFDDTVQTFFKMPVETQHWDTPVLAVAGPGGCEIVSYRLAEHDPNTWIVDRLFNQAELFSGTGKHAERVQIQRDGAMGGLHCGKQLKTSVTDANMARR